MLQRVGNIENCTEAKDKGNCEKPLLWSRERGWGAEAGNYLGSGKGRRKAMGSGPKED